MAGDWIKMRTSLVTSPKVVRMSSALKADRFRIVGGLLSVWCLFDSHSVDGVLLGYTPEALDELAAWNGFSAAMMTVGWLESDGENLVIPRFDTHNGASAKRRAQDSDRKRGVRNVSAPEADKKRTREEKRREEDKEKAPLPPEGDGDDEGLENGPEAYTADFESFWAAYPKRNSPSPKKAAWRVWKARVREGIDPQDLITAARHYHAEQRNLGKVGTSYVKHPATFLGPDDWWREYLRPVQAAQPAGARGNAGATAAPRGAVLAPNGQYYPKKVPRNYVSAYDEFWGILGMEDHVYHLDTHNQDYSRKAQGGGDANAL